MRRTINTRSMVAANTDRKARKLAAEASQEVGPFSYTSPILSGITLSDIEDATNGSGPARRNARLKIMAARRLAGL